MRLASDDGQRRSRSGPAGPLTAALPLALALLMADGWATVHKCERRDGSAVGLATSSSGLSVQLTNAPALLAR